jgi:CheY-like chemotaxis protein
LRILVVDDEPAVRELWVDVLTGSGFDVIAAVDGEDALQRLDGDTCDLVVSDLLMPRLGGWGLLSAIRQRYPDLPFILASGYAQTSDLERARRERVPLLEKPVAVRELCRVVQDVLTREQR